MKIALAREIADRLEGEIRRIVPDADLLRIDPDGGLDGDPVGTDVLLFSIGLSRTEGAMKRTLELMNVGGLRWVQGPGAGVDNPIWSGLLERKIRLTNASGIHAEPIAQYIFTYVLHWNRQVARHQAQQARRHWEILVSEDLTDKTLGIVGLGGIGAATARVAKAFGMRVLGLRRSPVEDPNVDRHFSPDELHPLLAESDYVVLCLPFTDETHHLIGTAELQAMRENSVLINVARGGVVDEVALIDALRRHRIRGASLDVTEIEPLPEDSPLWTLENCVLTPHDAGYSPLADERLGRLFLENLALFVRREPMRNEILETTLTR